jgi:hypothetical protein
MVVRLLVRGASSRPFTARTMPPRARPAGADALVDRIVRQSRARYATKRAAVEAKISRTFAPSSGLGDQGDGS